MLMCIGLKIMRKKIVYETMKLNATFKGPADLLEKKLV